MNRKRTKEKITHHFAVRTKRLMQKHELSIARLSAAIGISRPALSRYLDELTTPDIAILAAVSNYFNVSTDYLLGFTRAAQRRKDVECNSSEFD